MQPGHSTNLISKPETFGAMVAYCRAQRGLTVKRAARALNMKEIALEKIELDRIRFMRFGTIMRVAKYFNINAFVLGRLLDKSLQPVAK